MIQYVTNDPHIPCIDHYIQGKGFLLRIPLLYLHHAGEPETQHGNKLQYSSFASVIDILNVLQ